MEKTAPAALDLCVRNKRPPTPDYYTFAKRPIGYVDTPTCQYSPVSNSDSENSDLSERKSPYPLLSPKIKVTRPFKAYSKDLSLGFGAVTTETAFGKDTAFAEFRQRVMSQVQSHNGTNKNMRRVPQNSSCKIEDPTYWEKRRKNNEAAKRSRDARRAKEDEIAIRCAFLEQENLQLKFRIATLETERQRLQEIVYHT